MQYLGLESLLRFATETARTCSTAHKRRHVHTTSSWEECIPSVMSQVKGALSLALPPRCCRRFRRVHVHVTFFLCLERAGQRHTQGVGCLVRLGGLLTAVRTLG